MESTWKLNELVELSSESLQSLIHNEIPAIVINNFASFEEAAQFADAVSQMETKAYEFGKPGAYLGNPLSHYRNRPKEEYFAQVNAAEYERMQVAEKSFDPVARFIQVMKEKTDFAVSIAAEPDFGSYFAGIIRLISGGSDLHVDYAPIFARGSMSVGDISAQLAWNFYAASPKGGETVIYNRPYQFTSVDKVYKAYDSSLVEGCDSFAFKPMIGSVVIFNTSNPHAVLPNAVGEKGVRIATGSFIGLSENYKLVLWS
ncbi:2OG-Fe(II)-dependent halogenase WelO5 family protein [Pectobacterium sp. A5351]|uniref:2OG-Fe(II)-dependent halogenase WelO5 family protein n=1 Tax=Pectobacterium sp. A5351 TaxID=2914983 RepID=UPI00232E8176|nr:hypothetical protein [Pectobacterium sp. A5351]WCG82664.1 hypothetical protein O1Q74_17540 [Pectobacterium sp. A5351]